MAEKRYVFFDVDNDGFSSRLNKNADWEPKMNIIVSDKLLIVEIEIPGVDKDDVEVLMQSNNELIIKGVKKQPKVGEIQYDYYIFEREFGYFYKKIVIDFPIDVEKISSELINGVLKIEIPKKKTEKVSIEIK